ncbi:hypothetical protein BD289DRAFT_287676 [Coniella lustricola]|uniref:Proteophosphoglycan 5 n=1 Tax=Coniella lustricola TaxID=2025994 RepID=A0A2T3A5N8_9PEZI|nr:hypothetical protein BD289DRAFT_287676 [Coniella lustricola]
MEQSIPNKQTPARRNRGGARGNRGRKNYASEGDALSEMPVPTSFPATPMKSNHASPTPGSQPANSKSSTRRSTGKKARPNNVSTSPAPLQSMQRTPPPSSSIAMSSAAFASSSSFHSPAPGSLPRPSFTKFSRSQSCANSNDDTLLRVRSDSAAPRMHKEPSPPASDTESPSPPLPPNLVVLQQQATPLDFLFDAHRADQEKLRGANSANATSKTSAPFSAPPGSQHIPNQTIRDDPIPLNLPVQYVEQHHAPYHSPYHKATQTAPLPQHFGLPLHEQARNAVSTEPSVQQPAAKSSQGNHNWQAATPPHADKSEEMKRLLGIGAPFSKPMFTTTQSSASAPALPTSSDFHQSQPHFHGGDSMSNGVEHRKVMAEDALRKALGLNFAMSGGLNGSNGPQSHANRFPGHA